MIKKFTSRQNKQAPKMQSILQCKVPLPLKYCFVIFNQMLLWLFCSCISVRTVVPPTVGKTTYKRHNYLFSIYFLNAVFLREEAHKKGLFLVVRLLRGGTPEPLRKEHFFLSVKKNYQNLVNH